MLRFWGVKLTKCVPRAVDQSTGRPCGFGTSELRSFLRELRSLAGAPWKFRSRTAGTWLDPLGRRNAGLARTTGSASKPHNASTNTSVSNSQRDAATSINLFRTYRLSSKLMKIFSERRKSPRNYYIYSKNKTSPNLIQKLCRFQNHVLKKLMELFLFHHLFLIFL